MTDGFAWSGSIVPVILGVILLVRVLLRWF